MRTRMRAEDHRARQGLSSRQHQSQERESFSAGATLHLRAIMRAHSALTEGSHDSGRCAMHGGQAEVLPVTFERPRAVPETHDGPFTYRAGTPWIFSHQRAQDFSIPFFRMLYVEYGMECE